MPGLGSLFPFSPARPRRGRGAPPGVRSVRSQLRYCRRYLGATIGAQAVIESLVRQHPRVRIKSAAGDGVSSL